MQAVAPREIREWVIRYLASEITLPQLEEWLVPRTWDIERAGRPAAASLVYEVELRLAEYRNGHWTEEELRQKLLPLAVGHIEWEIKSQIRTESSTPSDMVTASSAFHLTPVGK